MIRIEDISGISCKGIRDNNEDYIIYDKNNRIIVLCDGMGGHGHGELASKNVAQTIYNRLSLISEHELTKYDLQKALEEAVCKLNEVNVFDDEKKMGTTLVVVAINKYELLVGHVGDSRFYHFNEAGIKDFRTRDHSKVAEAVEAEILTEEEARKSSYKNLLTRCVMAGKATPEMEIDAIPISGNNRIVICSDGLIDAVKDDELQEILIGSQIDNALSILNDKCKENSNDNYSIIIADLKQTEIIRNNDSFAPICKESHETIECQNCRTKNNKLSNYCCKCGIKLQDSPSPCTNMGNIDKIKNYFTSSPKFMHVLYALVIILSIFVCVSIYTNINKYTERNEEDVNAEITYEEVEIQSNPLRKYRNSINNFIKVQCKIESIKKDSFINKSELIEKYMEFEKEAYKKLKDDLSKSKLQNGKFE